MGNKIGRICCNISYGLFLTAGAALPMIRDDRKSSGALASFATTLFLSTVIVQVLKLVVPERRPDTGQKGSFPSGHTANTIALATLSSVQTPGQSAAWFGPAVGISLARIALRRHFIRDVVVGSLLGFALARLVASRIN